jgi:HD superfamily phosphohydrolase
MDLHDAEAEEKVMEEIRCKNCGALLSKLPMEPNLTSWGKPVDASHPKIVERTCECCGRQIRLFSQNARQVRFCPDCQKKLKGKKKRVEEGPLFTHGVAETAYVSRQHGAHIGEVRIVEPLKTFRDAVHGDIDLYEWEVKIIDTPDFQRLRGIKQLGLAYYAYSGALHTRFDHSIGTVFKAQEIVDALSRKDANFPRDQRNIEIIRLVALLHDIGHLPFGHTLEDEYKLFNTKHDQWRRLDKYIGLGTEIGTILVGKQYFKAVTSVLKQLGKEETDGAAPNYISDIVGNTVCADLFDYLMRDGHYCGLNLKYDERLIKYFEIDPQTQHLVVRLEKGGEFRRDNISELIGLLRNRYSLAEKVLFHHTKLAASAMLGRAIQLSGLKEQDLLHWREEDLLVELSRNADATVVELVRNLRDRKLHKLMFRVASEYGQLRQTREKLSPILHDDKEYREQILQEIEKKFDMPIGSLCFYCPEKEMQFKPAEVLVLPNGFSRPAPLSEIKDPAFATDVESLKTKHEGLWTLQLFLSVDQYPRSVQVAEAFKHIMRDRHHIMLENDLDARPSKRWQQMELRHKVIEEFAIEKGLPRQQEQHLQLELEKYVVVSPRKGDIQDFEKQYRQGCEEWWRQVGGK